MLTSQSCIRDAWYVGLVYEKIQSVAHETQETRYLWTWLLKLLFAADSGQEQSQD